MAIIQLKAKNELVKISDWMLISHISFALANHSSLVHVGLLRKSWRKKIWKPTKGNKIRYLIKLWLSSWVNSPFSIYSLLLLDSKNFKRRVFWYQTHVEWSWSWKLCNRWLTPSSLKSVKSTQPDENFSGLTLRITLPMANDDVFMITFYYLFLLTCKSQVSTFVFCFELNFLLKVYKRLFNSV